MTRMYMTINLLILINVCLKETSFGKQLKDRTASSDSPASKQNATVSPVVYRALAEVLHSLEDIKGLDAGVSPHKVSRLDRVVEDALWNTNVYRSSFPNSRPGIKRKPVVKRVRGYDVAIYVDPAKEDDFEKRYQGMKLKAP